MMDNYAIADQFSLLAKLMDIHGENAFKAKSYSSAAFSVERLTTPLDGLSELQISGLKGIGESAGKKIMEIIETGHLKLLDDLVAKTPAGVIEMMSIKGLGPKKIYTLWKEMHIETIAELEAACRHNHIAKIKGFGEKTEQKILESIEFIRGNEGKLLYKQVEDFAMAMQRKLEAAFVNERSAITGEFRRQLEIISKLEWVTTATAEQVIELLTNEQVSFLSQTNDLLILCAEDLVDLNFHLTTKKTFTKKLVETSCSEEFLQALKTISINDDAADEQDYFSSAGLSFIPVYLRESKMILQKAKEDSFDNIVQVSGIKGLIHSHSNWSDGGYTIEAMAQELIKSGFEYLVISDHSKAAAYASGLSEQKIKDQHSYIDSLNKKYAPFKIFKSIECDILGDGTLDYDDKTLASFDLVITSVHSNLDMEEDKAMMRLMGAISNPYTTILGHMTGRLLLKRKGYPVDHKAIIDACAANKVVMEINAAPSRLDMDWRWIDYALQKDVMLSIDPDAHALEEFSYIKYGTLVAQKGGLPASKNLSSFSLQQFEAYLDETRKKKGLVH